MSKLWCRCRLRCGYVMMCSCERSTDYITVRDGIDDDSALMATYCSSVTDASVTSSGETLSIELVSDEKKQRQGFTAQFAFVTDTDTSPVLPPSGGLVVDVTTPAHQLQTVRQQFDGMCLALLARCIVRHSLKLTFFKIFCNGRWGTCL